MKLPITLALLALTLPIAAQTPAAQTPQRIALVELFTSEGCSSCPPADALLRQLHNTRTPEGILILGLSEHVTYWNNLGWADPFSADTFTQRQEAYGQRFQLDSVYTPQAIVNGTRQALGSDRAALLSAIRATTPPSTSALHIHTATTTAGHVTLTFAADTTLPKSAELFAVLADDTDITQVRRGENSGRTLTHVSVARVFTRLPAASTTATLPLPTGPATPRHIILFAQDPTAGHILALTTQPVLPTP